MDHSATVSYIQNLMYPNLPDGRELVREGYEIGKKIIPHRGRFLREHGYDNFFDYKEECVREGKVEYYQLMGLATWEEQKEGMKEFMRMAERCGFEVPMFFSIFNMRQALPKELRDQMPSGAAYTLESLDQYIEAVEVTSADYCFADHHLATPNSLENVVNAVTAGSFIISNMAEILWDFPGFTDNVARFSDTVKSLGVCAAHYDRHVNVMGYLEDGIPGFFSDCASFVAFALMEKHIVNTLCGARYCTSFGGLLHEGQPRMALAMALDKVLSEPDEKQRGVLYINSTTTMQWDHDIDANYGSSGQEFLLEFLVNKKYKMGMAFMPVSITEALQVPTTQELFNIFACAKRIEERMGDWEDLVDFTKLEEMRDVMVEKGVKMFNNMLEGFSEAGVDINDPLQLFMLLKKYNPTKLETDFHPSLEEKGIFTPYFPTVLGRMTMEMRDEICKEIDDAEMGSCMEGKKVVLASADGHSYGLMLVESVLKYVGAEVINAGLSIEALDALEIADEEGTRLVGISVHSGQSYELAQKLAELMKDRDKDYYIFMGGKLNGILPGDSEPSDCTELINELGIHGIDDMFESLQKLMVESDK